VVATVHMEADRATIWAPTQGQDVIRDRIAKIFGLAEAAVTVHTTFVGGGFGRKFVPDFVIQAAFASKACGRPVKLIRSRAEDLRHDFYRPGLVARFEAALDDAGYPVALRARIAGQSLLYQMFPMWVVNGVDEATVEGTSDQPYAIPDLRVEMVDVPQILPMGFLRSVGRSANVFFVESFMDELAEKAGRDALAFRRHLLAGDARALAVLDAAAEHAGWSQALPPDRFRGIAYAPYIGRGRNFTTRVAAVLEIRRHASGACSVERVVVAIDPGLVINPNLVRAQVEGCVGFALSSVIKGEITLRDGRVDQQGFADFRLLTLAEMPDVETVIVQGDTEAPAGVGEAAMPVIGPALASALRAATGQRLRGMPFDRHVAFAPRWNAP
jgi:isoquinoline 1-oxidoreductase subunit beta